MYFDKIVAKSAEDAFHKILNTLANEGKISKPRGFEVTEIINMNIVILNPRDRIVTCKERKFSAPYAFGELAWYLSGNNNLNAIEYYSKFQKNCSDDGITLNSAYGSRIFGIHPDGKELLNFYPKIEFNQWKDCVEKLKKDNDTRQAIIHLHTPNNKQTKDEVCTLTLQFFIREGKLDMITNMRSNDVILGFVYDVFAFTIMQELMANELGVELGIYYHNVGSMHIYTKDFYNSKYDYLKEHTRNELPAMQKIDFTIYDDDVDKFISCERNIRENFDKINELIDFNFENEFEALYSGAFYLKANSVNEKFENQFEICQKVRDSGYETAADILQIFCKNKMQNKKVIVEGSDAVGKTTYIKRNLMNDYDVIHFVKPSEIFDYEKNYVFHLRNGKNEVFDRFFLSEVVYSNVLGRECRIDENIFSKLVIEMLKNDVKIIIINAEDEEQIDILKSRLKTNGDLDLQCYIKDINEKFLNLAKCLLEKGCNVEVLNIYGEKIKL